MRNCTHKIRILDAICIIFNIVISNIGKKILYSEAYNHHDWDRRKEICSAHTDNAYGFQC